jgi:hypothetical protein
LTRWRSALTEATAASSARTARTAIFWNFMVDGADDDDDDQVAVMFRSQIL